MLLRILGSAAGGGVPQWNCHCSNCRSARAGDSNARARTQSSIAVRGSNDAWALVNASPDILVQLRSHDDMVRTDGLRGSALRAIVLTDAQIDHATGLLMLREATRPWPLWSTATVYTELTEELPLLTALAHYCGIEHHAVNPGEEFCIDEIDDVRWRPIDVQSKAPPYSRDRESATSGSNLAFTITNPRTRRIALYAPGLAAMTADIWEVMQRADLVMIDGTCWSDDELARIGIAHRTARQMGHLPLSGPNGTLEWLQRLPDTTRKILTHINNTNPILDEASSERMRLTELGIEVAYDGMEVEL